MIQLTFPFFKKKILKPYSSTNIWRISHILLFGSEGSGIKHHTNKYTDFSVKININEYIESLNFSNSAAIVFHHINQHKKISW